jgi:hypothetical protein
LKSTKLLVITGKTFGVTNLLILNEEEKVIYSSRVMVKGDDTKLVTLTKGTAGETYNCTPHCEPVINVGDEPKHLQSVAQSAMQKMKVSEGGGSDSTQPSN